MMSRTHRRSLAARAMTLVVMVALGATLVACGGGEEELEDQPVVDSEVTITGDPSTSPTAADTPTAEAAASEVATGADDHVLAFLDDVGEAWGAQDGERLSGLATGKSVETLLETGEGEADAVWDPDVCGTNDGTGSCEFLFMPADQEECCAQIWSLSYDEDKDGSLEVTDVQFAGDAG